MYNEREALAYSGKLPAQQAAITPQLLDLLAMQKVKSDKDAAARQLAMVSGQALPTVAKGLEQDAMNSARQEIAQKMGLAGLLQSPAGPQPQGLMGAPTNLPTQYQGGGIIAFATGGSGGDAHGRYRQRNEQTDREQAAREAIRTQEQAITDDQLTDQTDYQSVDQISSSGGDAHGRYRQQDEQANADQPPEMSAYNANFIRGTQNELMSTRNQDPEALGLAEMAKKQEMLKPSREASIASKREMQAGLKALYERQIAERPSDLRVALDRMAQNINAPGGYGAAMVGVSQAGQAARQGYTNQEISQLKSLSAIDDEINKAIEDDDVDKYNTYVNYRKEVQGRINKALESSTTMSDVLQRALAGRQSNFATVQQRKENQILEDARKRQVAAEALRAKEEIAANLLAQKREANERLEREFKFKYAELGQARALASGDRQAKMVLDARERAMKAVYSDIKMTNASPEDREIAIDDLAAVLLKSPGSPKAATGIPANSTYGKVVPGKGTEVFVNGVLKGYAN